MSNVKEGAVKISRFNRRRFLKAALLASPFLVAADARCFEPQWLKTRRIQLGDGKPATRFVHFTDVHHKGDRAYLLSVVRQINALSPDFVCFTGDLIEKTEFLPEALEIFSGIKSPVYGVPGNHDYWSRAPFADIAKCLAGTGGAWLVDEQRVTSNGKFSIIGLACVSSKERQIKPDTGARSVVLMHYPNWVKKLDGQKFDLMLAGHSHGGQVRIPFYGPIFVPFGVDEYVMGSFSTASGRLYVNPGIGWFPWPIRFNCRPEITVFEV